MGLAACGVRGGGTGEFALVEFVQGGAGGVLLDETLIFRFSAELDRASVTSASIRIFDARNPERTARGRLRIHRDRLDFEPQLPRSEDLSDGGLLPDTEYTVKLAGFPRPDGLRSTDGELLASSMTLHFRTAPSSGVLFGGQESGGHLGIELPDGVSAGGIERGPLDPLVLTSTVGVDPRSLRRGEFCVLPRDGDPDEDVVPLLPRVVDNHPRGARIELFPAGDRPGLGDLRALDVGEYYLIRTRDEARDLAGNRLPFGRPMLGLAGLSRNFGRPLVTFSVVAPRRMKELVTFGGTERPWYGEPLGFDATAYWPDDGSGVSIRYPAAAGDGSDGPLDPFEGLGGRTDLAATSLRVPRGQEVDLSEAHGFLILRSQGGIEIEGRLTRHLEGTWPSSLADQMERSSLGPEASREALTAWIERARRLNEPWTVLVAGGDLKVTGTIRVDGPLLLISGGWLRIYGRVDADRVFKSDGGGENIERVRDAPLRLDPPRTNPLRHPLRAAILSNTHRPRRGVEAWLDAAVQGREGAGSFHVRFLGLRDRAAGSDRFEPVDDIRLLDGCEALRLLLILEMPAGEGEPWDPPRIDSVELSWNLPR
ncbi:MAG TPA: hypothetical protein ENJ09_06905 [Planctomycetes bacterium]|nr:hypothetical protein [Planctomycetota bacterium]